MNKHMMRQAQELQAKLVKAQKDLETLTVEASAGGGAVKVTMTGHQKLQSLKIAPEAVDPKEVEMLEEMVLAAMNEALEKSRELAARQLNSITGGLKIPGLT
jgi:DNA-binding YbaB/EbfC family protein